MLAACCLRGRQTMLTGPEWLVLQAVHGLPKDQYGHAHDAEIVSDTGLRLHEVAPSLESLFREGFVSRIRLADGHLAVHITARGTLELIRAGRPKNGKGAITGRENGSSLNSAFLTPKPPASSVYVRVLEAPSPLKRLHSQDELSPPFGAGHPDVANLKGDHGSALRCRNSSPRDHRLRCDVRVGRFVDSAQSRHSVSSVSLASMTSLDQAANGAPGPRGRDGKAQ